MIESTPAGVILRVRVIPRASHAGIDGMRGDALLVRLNASPVEGAANAELIEVLAGVLGVPRRDLTIVSGETSRHKRVLVAGAEASRVRDLLRIR